MAVWVWHGNVGSGRARLGAAGMARTGWSWRRLARFVLAGKAGHRMAGSVPAWHVSAGTLRRVKSRLVRARQSWSGVAREGWVWRVQARHGGAGPASQGEARRLMVGRGVARHGRHGWARPGTFGLVPAWLGTARQAVLHD